VGIEDLVMGFAVQRWKAYLSWLKKDNVHLIE